MTTSADGLYRPDGRQTEIFLSSPKQSAADGGSEGESGDEPEEGEEDNE